MIQMGWAVSNKLIGRWTAHVVQCALALVLMPCTAQQTATVPPSTRQAALALEQEGNNAEAEAAWRTYLKAHPASSEAYAHLGLLEARQEHYKQAVPLYRRALALDPHVPGLRLNLGLALFKGGELKESISEFKILLKSAPPNSPEAQRLTLLVAMAEYGVGDYAAAVPYLKEVAANDPNNLQLLLALAHSCLWSKQYQCVLDTYHKMLMLNAESAEADMLAGEALDELKDVPGAIQQFRNAIKANPREPDVHFGLGYLLWTQRQYPEAAAELQAELADNPNHAQALTYLGDADMQLNHADLALPMLEKAVQINPGLELAHLDLGILDSDAGRKEEALQELRTAAELAPNDTNVHWHLGRLYRMIGKKDEAKAEFDKASSLHKAEDAAVLNKMSPQPAPSQDSSKAPTDKP
jgi:tetratricopeptide (TPR) repeat protein